MNLTVDFELWSSLCKEELNVYLVTPPKRLISHLFNTITNMQLQKLITERSEKPIYFFYFIVDLKQSNLDVDDFVQSGLLFISAVLWYELLVPLLTTADRYAVAAPPMNRPFEKEKARGNEQTLLRQKIFEDKNIEAVDLLMLCFYCFRRMMLEYN